MTRLAMISCLLPALLLASRPSKAQTLSDSAALLIASAQQSIDAQQMRLAVSQTQKAAALLAPPASRHDSLLLAEAFHHQGRAYAAFSLLDSAVAAYENAAYLREKVLGSHFETSKTLSNLGDCLCRNQRLEEGLERLQQSLEMKLQLNPPKYLSVAYTQLNLSACYREKGDLTLAIALAQQALENQQKAYGDDEFHVEIGDSYNNLGVLFSDRGDYDAALHYYQKALAVRQKVHGEDGVKTAVTCNNLATWHIEMGAYAKALPLLEKAYAIQSVQPDPDPIQTGTALVNLSNCYSNLGDYQKALDYSLKALPLFEPGTANYVAACRNIGADYKNLKWYDRAIEYYQKTLPYADPEGFDAAWLYDQMAVCHRYLRQFERALDYHLTAIRIGQNKQEGDHPHLASFYSDFGVTFAYMEDWENARVQQERALEICREKYAGGAENTAIAYTELGKIYAREGQFRVADSLLQLAKSVLGYQESFVFDRVTAIPKLLFVLQYQAEIYRQWGEGALLRKSFETWQEAVAAVGFLYQNRLLLRQNLLEPGSFAEFLQLNHQACGGAIRAALDLYQITREAHWLEEAFALSERAKTFQLRHLAQEADWINRADLPPALADEEHRLRDQYAALERLRQDLRRSGMTDDHPRLLEISGQIFEVKKAYEQAKSRIREVCPPCHDQNFGLPVVGAPALQQMLPPDRVLLSFYEGEQTTFLFVIGKNGLRYVEIDRVAQDSLPEKMLEGLVQSQNQNLPDPVRTRYFEQYADAACRLFDRWLRPVWHELPEYLTILPDGAATAIPMEALLEKMPPRADIESGQYQEMKFVLHSKTISYAPSATLLAAVMQQAHDTQAPKSMLGVAASAGSRRAYKRSGREDLVLQTLPNTREEIRIVQRIMGGDVRMDSQATAAEFRRLATQYRFLHLALHARADDWVGDDSYLAFFDSLLYVRDIGNLLLQAEMVVLSGCKTGRGEQRFGEGTVGMSWAFIRAGAKSLFSTLWDVEDAAMKELAGPFYTGIQSGSAKDVALKQAKRELLRSTNYNHPYFWAGIIGMGDMRPVR
jgi:CHAT domain-containing protein/Tfp pilus assembly protein PilF